MSREQALACAHCRFAGIHGSGRFDWGKYPLGGQRYWAVHFMTCVVCGVIHCYGQDRVGDTECSDLYAQPEPVYLSRTTCMVGGDGRGMREEECDCVRLAPWLPCNQKKDRYTDPDLSGKSDVWFCPFFVCSVCRKPGKLASLFNLREGECCECPACGQKAFDHSWGTGIFHPLEALDW
jgi:hypothetical protein